MDNSEGNTDISLNNTYNFLPSTSPLRPTVLLSLISLLSLSSDLESLVLSPSTIFNAISTWDISSEEKSQFVASAAAVYASSKATSKALELTLIAVEHLNASQAVVDKVLVYAIADPKRYTVDDVLRVKGVKAEGTTGELISLFQGDMLESVKKGQEWVQSNKSWIESQSESRRGPDIGCD